MTTNLCWRSRCRARRLASHFDLGNWRHLQGGGMGGVGASLRVHPCGRPVRGGHGLQRDETTARRKGHLGVRGAHIHAATTGGKSISELGRQDAAERACWVGFGQRHTAPDPPAANALGKLDPSGQRPSNDSATKSGEGEGTEDGCRTMDKETSP